MEKLWALLAICLALAFLYENSYVETLRGNKRPWFAYAAMVAILICFSGFRGSYNDTWNYRDIYRVLAKGFPEAWETFSWAWGENPLFNIIQAWFKTYDADVHLFLMFFSFWTVLMYMNFIKKYSCNLVFSMFLFFTMGCYVFTLAAIKQCIATAICLFAIPSAVDKKWVRFYLLVVLASLFHPYAMMYAVVPLFFYQPWSKYSYILLGMIILGGYLLQPLLGTLVDLTAAIGEEYTEGTFSREGINSTRVVVYWMPVVISFIFRKELYEDTTREERLLTNLMMVNAGITFVGIFGTALYFARLANYFNMMAVIMIPWMMKKIRSKDKTIITIAMVICYLAYFWFLYTIENDFSSAYEALSLGDFLKILFDTLKGGGV